MSVTDAWRRDEDEDDMMSAAAATQVAQLDD